MALGDITSRQAVLDAVAEYDQLGRDAFLTKYGFGRSRDIFLVVGGKEYDAKAIIGVAHGLEFPNKGQLDSDSFTSGDERFRPLLKKLGFDFQDKKAPTGGPPVCYPDEVSEAVLAEGATKTVVVNDYERSREARKQCLQTHGTVCSICKFDFGAFYGSEQGQRI